MLARLAYPASVREPDARTLHLTWVDAAKGFGIFLVVFGHTLRGLVGSEIIMVTPIFRFVDAWIYAFHMPLFFFLSGLFLFRSLAKPWVDFAYEKFRTVVYPYFCWSAITLIVKALLSKAVNHPRNLSALPQIIYEPIDQFWFLYALFILLMVISIALKLGAKPQAVFLSAILVYPGLLPISSLGLGILNITRSMALYFALGVAIGEGQNIWMISCTPVHLLAVSAAAGLMISSLAGWCEPPYQHEFVATLTFAVGGIVAIVALALLADKARFVAVIRLLGRHSLEIYLVHTIASAGVRITLINFAHISAAAPHLVLGTLAGLYIPISIALFFERVGFQFGFRFPRSSWLAIKSEPISRSGQNPKSPTND